MELRTTDSQQTQSATQKTNETPPVRTRHPSQRMPRTQVRMACLGEASHYDTSSRLVEQKSKVRAKHQFTPQHLEPEAVRGKILPFRVSVKDDGGNKLKMRSADSYEQSRITPHRQLRPRESGMGILESSLRLSATTRAANTTRFPTSTA